MSTLWRSLRDFLKSHVAYQTSLTMISLGLALVLALILTLRFEGGQDLVVGAPSPRTINAPRDLIFESPALTEYARLQAANERDNLVYDENLEIPKQQRQQLQEIFDTITNIRANPSLSVDQRRTQITEIPSLPISATLAMTLLDWSDEEWQRVKDQSNALYDKVVSTHNFAIDEVKLQEIKTRYLPYNVPSNLLPAQREAVRYFVDHTLQVNRTLNGAATEQRQAEARAAIGPVKVTIVQGENIIRQGDRVTPEQFEKLVKLGVITPSLNINGVIARVLLALLVALALVFYVLLYAPQLISKGRALLVIAVLVAMPVLAARVSTSIWLSVPEAFPLAMAAIPLAVLFEGSLALVVSALVALLLGFVGDGAFALALISMAGAISGIYGVRRADRMLTFVRAGGWISLAVFLTALVWYLSITGEWQWDQVVMILLFSLINGSFSALLALGVINVLGRAAGIVMPMQLMELAHPNQPLLRRLMQEAPGTYHHSIVVSNLAEQAAELIGADPLLARVGAYYHDVGKMLRPYFFTDNQYDRSNVHDNLDPKTSAELIADHVIEGATLARKQGLPDVIVDFIVQHHGTDVIKYFYQQALQSDDAVDINDYRYPGPKPQTRETAILMLADGVEATVRSREQAQQLVPERDDGAEPSPKESGQTIAQVVNQIIDARVASGQLDECPLTLRDLQIIRRSFVKTLQGIYHPRVVYPTLTKDMQHK